MSRCKKQTEASGGMVPRTCPTCGPSGKCHFDQPEKVPEYTIRRVKMVVECIVVAKDGLDTFRHDLSSSQEIVNPPRSLSDTEMALYLRKP